MMKNDEHRGLSDQHTLQNAPKRPRNLRQVILYLVVYFEKGGFAHHTEAALKLNLICEYTIWRYAMTKAEAEQFARRCLYVHRENTARLEQKMFKYEIVRERGSCIAPQFSERGGKTSAGYIESIPMWLEEIEALEAEIIDLRLIVPPITRLLHDLEEAKQEEFIVYKLKYERKLSWAKARDKAAEEHGIGSSSFKTLNNELLRMAVCYLDRAADNIG
jgi:hypothetical protein